MNATIALAQAGDIAGTVKIIATSQIIMAVAMVLILGIAAVAGVMMFSALRSLVRTVHTLERELAPRAQPLLDQAAELAEKANRVADDLRQDVDSVHDTVAEINRRVRRAADATEQRVRRLGAMLDVVQEEAQNLLIETTATARGAQAAARALREHRSEDRPGRDTPGDEDEGDRRIESA
ncbi:MAG TPA: DUF948 domain-containing protein [Longimicrobiales bacterium]|nr:DUF948 domain-containing protein [Longimicrobiales bacterium]